MLLDYELGGQVGSDSICYESPYNPMTETGIDLFVEDEKEQQEN